MITFLPDDYTPPPPRSGLRYAAAAGLLVLAAAVAIFTYFQADVLSSERAHSSAFTASAHASSPREVSPSVPFHEQYGVRLLEPAPHIEAF